MGCAVGCPRWRLLFVRCRFGSSDFGVLDKGAGVWITQVVFGCFILKRPRKQNPKPMEPEKYLLGKGFEHQPTPLIFVGSSRLFSRVYLL